MTAPERAFWPFLGSFKYDPLWESCSQCTDRAHFGRRVIQCSLKYTVNGVHLQANVASAVLTQLELECTCSVPKVYVHTMQAIASMHALPQCWEVCWQLSRVEVLHTWLAIVHSLGAWQLHVKVVLF